MNKTYPVTLVVIRDCHAKHRYCDMHGQWIPDNEHQPVCDLHRAFSLTLTPIARKGGAQ